MKKLPPLILAVLAMTAAGCEREPHKISSANGDRFNVDTIYIRNKAHEIIRDGKPGYRGGIMHSPECWCGKEVKE